MKIGNNYHKYLQTINQTQKHINANKAEETKHVKKDKAVEVNISEEAKKLSELSSQEAHAKRIEEIKSAIQKGTYEVNPREIAKGIIDTIAGQKGTEE